MVAHQVDESLLLLACPASRMLRSPGHIRIKILVGRMAKEAPRVFFKHSVFAPASYFIYAAIRTYVPFTCPSDI
jgi:hypothetical protein